MSDRPNAKPRDGLAGPRRSEAQVTLHLARDMQLRPRVGEPSPLAPRDAVMLAWLALEGPTPRQRLAQLLWPESDSAAAHNALRQRIFKLHKLAGEEIVVGRLTLSLATGIDHDLGADSDVLGDADHRFTGEMATWLAQRRQHRRQAVRLSLLERFVAAEAGRDHGAAAALAADLLALDPLSEEAHRRVMRTHYVAGERAAALLAFDHCERVLKDEVGVRPGAETLALLRTIESADASAGSAPVATAVPAGLLRPPRLIGRRGELAAALRGWDRGQVFCLEGEAGMGKTRLLQEIAAGRPGTVSVPARPGDAVVPFATLARLLRAVLQQVPGALDEALRQSLARLLPELALPEVAGADAAAGASLKRIASEAVAIDRAVASTLATSAGQGVGAVLVDDLQFADDASLDLLLSLARDDAAPALRWGFARRPEEGSAALAALVEGLLEARRFEPVPLRPLDQAQLAELLASLALPPLAQAELAASLHRHCGGNPMFALETLRHAWSSSGPAASLPRPTSVTRLIERRVMRLSPAAIRLARCAAVAGAEFTLDLASAVLARPAIDLANPWHELEQAEVFADGSFAHDLIREAVDGGLPAPISRHLHGEVARHLELRSAPPAAIASHWLAAGDAARSLPFLHLAGERAAGQRRFAEAAAAFEREARLRLDAGDTDGAFAAALCMREAAFELDLGHRTDAALDLLDQAARTPPQRANAAAQRAIVCMHRGAMDEAESAVVAGIAALGTLAEAGLRARLNQHLAAVRVWQQRPAEAFELLRAIEDEVESGSDVEARLDFAQAYAVVLEHIDHPAEAARWYRRAADTALVAGQMPRAAQTLLNLAIGWRDSGRLDLALATLEEAQALLASLPEGAIPYSSLDLNFGIVMRDLGRYGESLEWLERAIERGRENVPGWVPLFLCHRVQIWLALGQHARAGHDLEAANVAEAPPLAQARREMLHAQWLGLLGRPSGAAFERATQLLGPSARALSRQRMVLAQCVGLDPEDALAAAATVLAAATISGRAGVVVAARTRLCDAAFALGRVDEAVLHALPLAALAAGHSSDETYRGEAWLAAARALAGPCPERAATLLRRAAAWLRDTAQNHVPASFRESFLHRNAVNRELLALAQRLLT